ncbi:MAG TPA: hypothetical protein VMR25_25865 [Planctomycetaceae bacterium]|jgi:hypothetical protein|nr:hypothetical protein [Planctomycetaceae bacterium]
MKTAQLWLTLAIVAALPGCGYLVSSYHGAAAWTGRQWSSEKAWRARKWMYADIPCRGSFKSGFKAGYRFASGGYDSCEPPQYRHYWRINKLSESERQNAQAWSDGFTNGTVAAQQDHAVGPSAFETAAMQPPEGVPDVRYYTPPPSNEMDQGAGFPYSPNAQSLPQMQEVPPPGYQSPPSMGENYQYAPNAGNFPYAPNAGNSQYAPTGDNSQYSPAPVLPPVPAPASEAAPSTSNSGQPHFAPPPPAPGSLPAANIQFVPTPMTASEGAPGIGSLRTAVNLQPAPPAEPAIETMPQQQAGNPSRQTTQAADWELPLIRD